MLPMQLVAGALMHCRYRSNDDLQKLVAELMELARIKDGFIEVPAVLPFIAARNRHGSRLKMRHAPVLGRGVAIQNRRTGKDVMNAAVIQDQQCLRAANPRGEVPRGVSRFQAAGEPYA